MHGRGSTRPRRTKILRLTHKGHTKMRVDDCGAGHHMILSREQERLMGLHLALDEARARGIPPEPLAKWLTKKPQRLPFLAIVRDVHKVVDEYELSREEHS